jgi:uncharacterized protein (DUF3820 family)
MDDKTPMPFGKHVDVPLGDVPASYLLWLLTELDGKPRDAVREELFQYLLENEELLTDEVREEQRSGRR